MPSNLVNMMPTEIEQLQKELAKLEAENEEKQQQLIEEQNLLTQVRKEKGLQQRKHRQVKESLELNEKALHEFKLEFDKKQMQLVVSVKQFNRATSIRNEKFKMALQILGRVTINNEDRYGNMEEYKRMMRKQIDEFKSEIALGRQEVESKRNELEQLKKEFYCTIDQPEIGPELKREISAAISEALSAQRKHLVDLKMLNHDMKFRCEVRQKF